MPTIADHLTGENRDEIDAAGKKNSRSKTKYGHLLGDR